MTKAEQNDINFFADRAMGEAMREAHLEYPCKTVRLRHCTAEVIITTNWYILRSYNTLVAAINRKTGVCYDVLRLVYGYTATSAQHITKFGQDYGETERLTYR